MWKKANLKQIGNLLKKVGGSITKRLFGCTFFEPIHIIHIFSPYV